MYYKLNEEIFIKTTKRIRDAIHDIVTKLNIDEFYDLGTLSNILRHEYNIFLTPKLLERLFSLWEDKKDGVFIETDKKWLKWDNKLNIVENNVLSPNKKGVLGKSKRRIYKKEEKDLYDNIKNNGWVKISDGRFVYNANIMHQLSDEEKNSIIISKLEKDEYEKGFNPITPELISNILVLNHPNDADLLSMLVDNAIKTNEIKYSFKDGRNYYNECFNYFLKISKERKFDFIRGWEKYAPSKYKMLLIKNKKRVKFEKEQENLASNNLISDRNEALNILKDIINVDDKYFVLLNKYDETKKVFMIKKLLYGNFTISDNKYENGYYKIVLRINENNDIMHFDTIIHLKRCIENSLRIDDKIIVNIIENNNLKKLKIYFKELRRYKEWDEYLDSDVLKKLKNYIF